MHMHTDICLSLRTNVYVYMYMCYFFVRRPTADARYGVYVYTYALYRMLPCDSHTEICVRLMCVGLTNDMSVTFTHDISLRSIHDTE